MADVKLSTLRVSAEMDASKYVAGAAQIETADQKMVQANQQVVFSFNDTTVKVSQSGDVLARLSRQYVDGYAAAQRMGAALTQLSGLIDKGKISMAQSEVILDSVFQKYQLFADGAQFAAKGQTEFAAAIERSNAKLREQQFWHNEWLREFNKQPVNRPGGANQNTLGAFGAFNTGQQIQDIAVTAAMGQSIPTIALQQGLQLGTALEIQLENAKKSGQSMGQALSTSFLGLLSPINLAAIAVTGLAAATIQYFMSSSKESKTYQELLKEELDLVDKIGKRYGEVALDKEKLLQRSPGSMQRELSSDQTDLLEALRTERIKATDALTRFVPAKSGGQYVPERRFEAFGEPILRLVHELQTGRVDVKAFDDAMDGVVKKNPGLRKQAEEIEGIVKAIIAAYGEVGLLATALDNLRKQDTGRRAFHPELAADITPEDQTQARVRAVNAQAAAAAEAARRQIRQDLETQRQGAALAAEIAQINARTMQERIAAAKQVEEARFVQGEEDWQKALRVTAAVARETAQAERELNDARRERQFAREDLISDTQNELATIGKIGGAAAAARKEFELMQELRDKVRRGEETQEQADKEAAAIHKVAEAYGQVIDAIAKANLQADLRFQASIAGLSDEEAAIARTLRGAGIDDPNRSGPEAAMLRQMDQIQRLKETWQDLFDTVNEGMDGVVDALFEGTDPMEALKKSARELTRQIFDLAVTNPLKNWLTGANQNTIADLGIFGSGASSGRGGGFGGVLGGLFGAQGALSKSVASMQVAAGTVIVNGGVAGGGGILGALGLGGTGTTAANDNLTTAGGTGIQDYIQKRISDAFGDPLTGGSGSDTLLGMSGSISKYAAAIKSVESSGNYGALGDVLKSGDRAYGAYQVMGSNVGPWTEKWFGQRLTPQQFLRNPAAQDSVFNGEFGSYVDKWGPSRAANAWFTGSPDKVARDINISSTEYVSRFNKALEGTTGNLGNLSEAGNNVSQGMSSLAQGFQSFGSNLSSMLSSFMANPMGGGSSWFQGLSSLFGGASGAFGYMNSISPAATASIIGAGGGFTGLFHTGGIAGQATQFRSVDPSVFMNARRYHMGGIAGDEVPAILKRGEPVFRSMEHARQAVGNDNATLTQILAQLKRMKLQATVVNVDDPNKVGRFLRRDAGEAAIADAARRMGNQRAFGA